MKKILTGMLLIGNMAFATDYAAMSLDDMILQKGSIPVEDRAVFQSEMQTKMSALTPEQRATVNTLRGSSNTSGTSTATTQGVKQQKKDGTGGGNQYKGSRK